MIAAGRPSVSERSAPSVLGMTSVKTMMTKASPTLAMATPPGPPMRSAAMVTSAVASVLATLLPPDPAMNILATGSELLTGSAAMLRAGAMADKASSRIAVAPGRSPEADFFAAVLVPLALSASTVLVVNAEPSRMTAIARAERADEWHN